MAFPVLESRHVGVLKVSRTSRTTARTPEVAEALIIPGAILSAEVSGAAKYYPLPNQLLAYPSR
jgi:hypothetical protein